MAKVHIKIETDCANWLAALHVGTEVIVVPHTNNNADLAKELVPGAYEVTIAAYQIPSTATVKIVAWTDPAEKKSRAIYARKGRFAGRIEFLIDAEGKLS